MKNIFIALFLSLTFFASPAVALEQPSGQAPAASQTLAPQFDWDGNLNITNNTGEQNIGGIATKLINWMLAVIALVATIVIIYAGVQLVFNAGNERRVAQAKTTLIWAIIGLVVALGAFAIVNIVQGVLS